MLTKDQILEASREIVHKLVINGQIPNSRFNFAVRIVRLELDMLHVKWQREKED